MQSDNHLPLPSKVDGKKWINTLSFRRAPLASPKSKAWHRCLLLLATQRVSKQISPVLFILLLPRHLLTWSHACHALVAELAMSMPSAIGNPANAGKPITTTCALSPDQAVAHIGEQVSVCGKAYSTRFLNMGGEYTDKPATAMSSFDKHSSFCYKPEEDLKGKIICVTDVVKNYKEKSEIMVEKRSSSYTPRIKISRRKV